VQVLVRKEDCSLRQLSEWDTLGFRGTCSPGFEVKAIGRAEQILPVPYAFIHSKTMHPVRPHRLGLALERHGGGRAGPRPQRRCKAEARRNPSAPPSPPRASRSRHGAGDHEGHARRRHSTITRRSSRAPTPEAFSGFGFAIRVNNLKMLCSQLVLEVATRAMVICGIQGYRNDFQAHPGRHLRDAMGAGLMVNNDRILGQNATMHVGLREG
jgi:acyl-CoA dehydrogenase